MFLFIYSFFLSLKCVFWNESCFVIRSIIHWYKHCTVNNFWYNNRGKHFYSKFIENWDMGGIIMDNFFGLWAYLKWTKWSNYITILRRLNNFVYYWWCWGGSDYRLVYKLYTILVFLNCFRQKRILFYELLLKL